MKKYLFGILITILSTSAFAFPQAPFDALKSNLIPPLNKEFQSYDFEGIIKLSNCSGSVIQFNGQSLDDNALVLTNGHCLGGSFLKPGEVTYKKPSRRRMKVADKNMRFHRVTAIELVYGTMTDTDSAIYKLKETYRDLKEKFDVTPFLLSDRRPTEATKIEIISGYWERGYSCHIDAFIHTLREASWTFTDSIRYSDQGCETIGGTSGSPIIEKNTRLVIGVNNTGNESGRRCTMNNPCEVDENDYVTVRKGASYGQQTYKFYNCMNKDYELDLSLAGCNLPK